MNVIKYHCGLIAGDTRVMRAESQVIVNFTCLDRAMSGDRQRGQGPSQLVSQDI